LIIAIIKSDLILLKMAEVLSKDEQDVLESLRKLNRTMGEDEYHMISSTLDSAGMGLGFEYELNYWEKVGSLMKIMRVQ